MFGKQLKKLRKEKGLTQKQLAEYLNVSKSSVGMWEHGDHEPDTSILSELADYFGVTVDYLLGREQTISTQQALIKETIEQIESLNQQVETLNRLKEHMKDLLPPE